MPIALRRTGQILLAYVMSSFASGFLLGNVMNALVPDSDSVDLSPLDAFLGWLYLTCWMIPATVAAFCFVPAFFIILYAEIYNITKKQYYIIAAMAAGWAIDCIIIIANWERWPPLFGMASLVFGWVGGYIYWRFAGRHAGHWSIDKTS